MNRLLTSILLLVTVLGFTTGLAGSDRWETLRAINWVENPTNQTRVGRFGELGPYQFRPTTWRMHTDKPFKLAIDRATADEVAVRHYEWIKRSLAEAGAEPNVFNIAMAWNCGVSAVIQGRAPSVSYQYAERVSNLVATMKQQARPAAVAVAAAPVSARPVLSLDAPALSFSALPDAPRYAVVMESEVPVVQTARDWPTEPAEPVFTVSTTPSFAPKFALLPSLLD